MALPTNSRSQQAGPETQNGAESQEIEEILVTAQKRDENARDVPITISAFDEAAIQQHGFTSLTDYAKFVPGLIYNGTGIGERSGPDITIRGIANSRLYDMETNIGTPTTALYTERYRPIP